ncbi:OLC1v1019285C1 [Oldenlandia corymbosa var. corymbosa]|uniref:OLC1v1019285C1 n=1 Tax=Oldenlandia corymbosa var. corymbosa TaxID=529605 RepID=A0AAV1EDI9_OLDCO|nr:OLC1v1019285C1 [Oldenlandia corymbosa var. corymbosa]
MKSKQSSIRPVGQRSIQSTFIRSATRPGTGICEKDVVFKAGNEKGSRVSFSEFLSRKLHRNSVLPGFAKGKEEPSISPVGCKNLSSLNAEKGKKEAEEDERDFAIDIVLQQFKHTKTEKESARPVGDNEHRNATADAIDESRKRKRADQVEYSKKVLAVLGDDSGVKRERMKKNLAINETPKVLYNHYANGGGWWDCNMEGVDNEEVGCSEVWEGVGTATLGGLDWN